MPKYRLAAFVLALAAASDLARAENPPLPPPRPAATTDAAKDAFLAMPEADRKAVQDALGWLGHYNGVVDGGFGKRTLDGIAAYQSSVKAAADGIVTPAQLASLKLAAQMARAAVGFRVFDDPTTGIRIGAPLKWLDKKSSGAGLTRLAAHDGAISLELMTGHEPLADLYKKSIADIPGRKVTYKAIKPDNFFVVGGEEGDHSFYLRYAQSPNDPTALRGFVFTYPTAEAAKLIPISLAIANAFEPFPSPPGKPADVAPTPPTPSPTPSAPALTATALIVAPGQALTVLREADCREPTILGKPVKFLKVDPSGIALIGGDFGAGATPPRHGAADADLVVLSLAPAAAGKATLEASDADPRPIDAKRRSVIVGLGAAARGAPAFDRQGGLAGLIAPAAAAPRRFGGVIIAEPRELIAGAALADFAGLAEAATASEPLGAAEIARRMHGAIVGVFCAP